MVVNKRGRNATSASKPNVAELDVAEDIDGLDLTGMEKMEAVRVVLLLVHFQHPPVWVTLDADKQNCVKKTIHKYLTT